MMLLYYRKQAKLTQKEVAKYLDCAESTYSLYENGKRQIGFEDLLKLGELYNVSVEDLVGDKKMPATEDDGEQDARKAKLIELFESLPSDRQDAVLRQLQEIVRLQKAQDDLLRF